MTGRSNPTIRATVTNRFKKSGETGNLYAQQPRIGPRRMSHAWGRVEGLTSCGNTLCRLIMLATPGWLETTGPGQNRIRLTVHLRNPPHGGFFLVTRDQLFVTCDQLFVTFVFPLSLRVKRSNPVNMRDFDYNWIATPPVVARNDKVWCIVVLLSQVLHTVSLRATRSNPDTFTSYPWLTIRDL